MTIVLHMRDTAIAIRRGTTPVTERDWPVQLIPPSSTSAADVNPREKPAYRLRWARGFYRAPPEPAFAVGDRLSVGGADFEILTPPRPLRDARRVVGDEADAHTLAHLYPREARILDQASTELADGVPLATWGGSETHDRRGTYENLEGETPIEFAAALQTQNAVVEVDGERLRVTEAVVDTQAQRVKLTLRRPGG